MERSVSNTGVILNVDGNSENLRVINNIHAHSCENCGKLKLNDEYLAVINENKELRVLLNKAIQQLKTKELIINILLNDE